MTRIKDPETNYADIDFVFASSNIFRPLSRRRNKDTDKHEEQDRITKWYGNRTFIFARPLLLGPTDLRVLLAICAISGIDKQRFECSDLATTTAIVIPDELESFRKAITADLAKVGDTTFFYYTSSIYRILKEAGFGNDGASYNRVRESIIRLGKVTYYDSEKIDKTNARPNIHTGGHMLFHNSIKSDKSSVKSGDIEPIKIVLGYRLSSALDYISKENTSGIKSSDKHYLRVDMALVRGLADIEMLVHINLLSRIWRRDTTLSIGRRDIRKLVYGGIDESGKMSNDASECRKTNYVLKALKSLNAMKIWAIEVSGSKLKITRLIP